MNNSTNLTKLKNPSGCAYWDQEKFLNEKGDEKSRDSVPLIGRQILEGIHKCSWTEYLFNTENYKKSIFRQIFRTKSKLLFS
jgi:hypothetical protein